MAEVLEGSRPKVTAGSRSLFKNVDWRRGLLPVSLDFVGSEVFVVGSLEIERHAGLRADTEFLGHTKPDILFDGEHVVAALFEDVFIELEEIDGHLLNLGLGVELCAAFCVKVGQLLDEVLPFIGAVDGVPGHLWWSHCNGC